MMFLGQKVNNFGLNTSANKFETIRAIEFPRKFKDFETYVGMTNYLRNYVPYYAQLIELLQKRKTLLFRDSPTKRNARKTFSRLYKINIPSEKKLVFFEILQNAFSRPFYLVHHDPNRFLHVDVDVSKQ